MELQNVNLIRTLADCAAACNTCSTACLSEQDVKMMAECIRLDMDCAQICGITADFVARGSAHAQHLLRECAEICGKCAAECEKHKYDHCKKCAEACRKCEDACRPAK